MEGLASTANPINNQERIFALSLAITILAFVYRHSFSRVNHQGLQRTARENQGARTFKIKHLLHQSTDEYCGI
jgi:hypothetical protein